MTHPRPVLVVDNFDSFVYNLVQYLGQLGVRCVVRRNDAVRVDELADLLRSGVRPGSPFLVEPLVRARLSAGFLRGLDDPSWTGAEADAFRASLARHEAARESMTLRNLRLVFSVVKRYQGLGRAPSPSNRLPFRSDRPDPPPW